MAQSCKHMCLIQTKDQPQYDDTNNKWYVDYICIKCGKLITQITDDDDSQVPADG